MVDESNKFEYVIKAIKAVYYTISGWYASSLLYFAPIKDLTICIVIAFIINFVMGIITGIFKNGEALDSKKATMAFFELAVYLVILTCGYTWGEKMGELHKMLSILSILTCSWIYILLVNFLKNASRMASDSKGIRFAYYALSLEFIKYLPILKRFDKSEKEREIKLKKREHVTTKRKKGIYK